MNKKYILKLTDFFFLLATVLIFFFSYRAFRAGYVPPQNAPFTAVAGLLTPFLLAAGLLAAVYWLIRRKWVLLILPVAAIGLQYNYIGGVYRIGESQDMSGNEIAGSQHLMIGTLNVHNFGSDDKIHNIKSIAYFFDQEGADIVCLQEYSNVWKFGEDSILKVFGKYPYSVLGKGKDSTETADIALFSRFPATDSGFSKFPDSNAGYLWADIALVAAGANSAAIAAAPKIRVFTVHLESTGVSQTQMEMAKRKQYTGSWKESVLTQRLLTRLEWSFIKRSGQIARLLELIRESPYPVLLCGDFNDTPASYAYNRITDHLTDAFRECGRGYGYTYKYFHKLLRIDYVFYGKEFRCTAYKSPDKPWSDHNPVLTGLELWGWKN